MKARWLTEDDVRKHQVKYGRQQIAAANPDDVAPKPPMKPRKYRNVPANGKASKHEAYIGEQLEAAKRAVDPAHRVVCVMSQVKFLLIPAQEGERECSYYADYVALYADQRFEVIDAKSEVTRKEARYVMKRKLMLERYGIRIREL